MIAPKTFAEFRAEQPEFFAKLELVIQLQAFASRWELQLTGSLNLFGDGWADGAAEDLFEYLDVLSARQSWA